MRRESQNLKQKKPTITTLIFKVVKIIIVIIKWTLIC